MHSSGYRDDAGDVGAMTDRCKL